LKFPAAGVGSSVQPGDRAALPGQDEDPVAAVCRADIGSAKARPLRVIPERGQVGEDAAEAAGAERGDVLHERDARS